MKAASAGIALLFLAVGVDTLPRPAGWVAVGIGVAAGIVAVALHCTGRVDRVLDGWKRAEREREVVRCQICREPADPAELVGGECGQCWDVDDLLFERSQDR